MQPTYWANIAADDPTDWVAAAYAAADLAAYVSRGAGYATRDERDAMVDAMRQK